MLLIEQLVTIVFVNLVHQDRKFTLETIEKMKQPKSTQHKKKISKSITTWWVEKKQEDLRYATNTK